MNVIECTEKPKVNDFLGRGLDDNHSSILKIENENFLSYIYINNLDFHIYRELKGDLIERVTVGGTLEFPVIEYFDRSLSIHLIGIALKYLEKKGINKVYMCLPFDTYELKSTIAKCGFYLLGISKNKTLIFEYNNGGKASSPYQFINYTPVRTSASSIDAPKPDSIFWNDASILYSGYSGYLYMKEFLNEVMPKDGKNFLSVPSASGDALRFMPRLENLKEVTGIDLNSDLIKFAKTRLNNLDLDEVNIRILSIFNRNKNKSFDRKDYRTISKVIKIFKPTSNKKTIDETIQYLKTGFEFGISSNAVSDYWILLKALSSLHTDSEMMHPLTLINSVMIKNKILNKLSAILDINKTSYSYKVSLESINIFDSKLPNRKYDTIFVYEAFLMFFASGKHIDFLELLIDKINENGTIILTGIRTSKGIPYELEFAEKYFVDKGFKSSFKMFSPKNPCGNEDLFFPYIIVKSGGKNG